MSAMMPGDVVRFDPGGPAYRIVRVSACAVYRQRVGVETRAFETRVGESVMVERAYAVEPGISLATPVSEWLERVPRPARRERITE